MTTDDLLVLSYFDVDVYERDLKLFENRNWLNDTCINYCFKRLLNSKSSDVVDMIMKENVLLLDPSLVSFLRLQCEEDDEFEDLRMSLELDNKLWVFIPINDNQSFESSSSHWSSLLCHVDSHQMLYYDSVENNPNLASANNFIEKFARLMKWDAGSYNLTIMSELSKPVQTNGFDCGVYCLLFLNHFLSKFVLLSQGIVYTEMEMVLTQDINESISPAAANKLRNDIYQDIRQLASVTK